MTMPEPFASQRELDILRDEVHRLDDHGSRGVGTIQAQLTDLVKDVGKLESEVSQKFAEHIQVHKEDQQNRVTGRRWMIGISIAGLGSLGGVFGMLVYLVNHLR
jgi:ribosomal protein S15P/S13E